MATDLRESNTGQLEISCQSCGAKLVVEAEMRSTLCPYCASPSIVSRPASTNRPAPAFLVGFVVDHEHATAAVKNWIRGSHLFVRSDFKAAVPELTRGVYLPAYLYNAVASTEYSASIGENYTETETYTTTDSKGNSVTRTRTVTKTEWRSLQGHHACYIVDVVVSASKGVSNDALEAVEPYDLRAMRRYDDSFIAGWLAEDPSRSKEQCYQFAHKESVAKVAGKLDPFMPGDSHSNLQYRVDLSNEVVDFVLLPIWTYAVRYAEDRPPVQILVNGQTGRVGGKVPVSTTKVTVAVVAVLLVIGVIVLLVAAGQ